MEAYKCVYRDPKSPLTPLTPLSNSSTPFDFDFVNLGDTLRNLKSPLITPSKKLKPADSNHLRISNPKTPTGNKSPCTIKITLTPSNQRCGRQMTTPGRLSHTPVSKLCYAEAIQNAISPGSARKSFRQSFDCIQGGPDRSGGANNKENKSPNVQKCRWRCFQKTSPVPPKALSPRVAKVLEEVGQTKYAKLFQKEEIDLEVFKMLSENDLFSLGVNCSDDVQMLKNAVKRLENVLTNF